MFTYFHDLLTSKALAPHGYCLLWRPELVWTHVGSDAVIGLSYVSIAIALLSFVRRRTDVAFGWIFWSFSAFILLCGATHIFSIWTLWHPDYGAEALVKLATAIVSAITAILLWPLIPRALALPSPQALRLANEALLQEMDARSRSEAMLRQSQKIEAVGQLTGGVAHDFNNLLTVIGGNIELATRSLGGSLSERVTRFLGNATKGVDQAKTLTTQLLAFSRKQTLDPRPTDVNALIDHMSKLLDRALGETVVIRTELDADLWTVAIDANQLEAALLNLAVNARDAMTEGGHSGGKLTIETANSRLDEGYAALHAEVSAGDYVVVCVSDTGVGMDPDTIARAHEPFFTTKEVGRGTGLGLSQVFGFIKQSGGHLKIYSEPGHGTTVKLYLPRLIETEQPRLIESEPRSQVTRGSGETILVVEDDPGVRSYVVESLRELGYRVIEAHDAEAGLAAIRTHAEIELLVTDVVMPGRNGRELADDAASMRSDLRVLFMTGYARNAISHAGKLDRDVHLIVKPFAFGDLATKVRETLSSPGWVRRNH